MPISPECKYGQIPEPMQVRTSGRRRTKSVRRFVLRAGAAATFLTLAAGTFTYSFIRAYDRENPNVPSHGHFGEGIINEFSKAYVTDPMDGGSSIEVRGKPSLSNKDIIGYLKAKNIITAEPVLGPVYPSYPESLGKFEQGGYAYGHWYKVTTVVYQKDKEGNLVPKMDPKLGIQKTETGYIQGTELKVLADNPPTPSK